MVLEKQRSHIAGFLANLQIFGTYFINISTYYVTGKE